MTGAPQTDEQILQSIREEMTRIKIPGAQSATIDSDWAEMDVDSLDLVELVTALEDRFQIKIADGELKEISGVGDAVRLVQRLSSAGAVA